MAENEGTVGADVVDVIAAVLVGHATSVGFGNEPRSEIDSAESTDGRVDATGHYLFGFLEELVVSIHRLRKPPWEKWCRMASTRPSIV